MHYRIDLNKTNDKSTMLLSTQDRLDIINVSYLNISFDLTKEEEEVALKILFRGKPHTSKIFPDIYKEVITEFINRMPQEKKDSVISRLQNAAFYNPDKDLQIDSKQFVIEKQEAQQLLTNFFDSLFKFFRLIPGERKQFNDYCQEHGLDYSLSLVKSPLQNSTIFNQPKNPPQSSKNVQTKTIAVNNSCH